jgi:hypothetical protein
VMRGGTYFRNAQLWGCYPTYSIGTNFFHFVLWYLEDTCQASWEKWAKKRPGFLKSEMLTGADGQFCVIRCPPNTLQILGQCFTF